MEACFQWGVDEMGGRYRGSPFWTVVIGIKGDTSKYTEGHFRFAISITISEGIRFAHVSLIGPWDTICGPGLLSDNRLSLVHNIVYLFHFIRPFNIYMRVNNNIRAYSYLI